MRRLKRGHFIPSWPGFTRPSRFGAGALDAQIKFGHDDEGGTLSASRERREEVVAASDKPSPLAGEGGAHRVSDGRVRGPLPSNHGSAR